jgi:hypothetical protein
MVELITGRKDVGSSHAAKIEYFGQRFFHLTGAIPAADIGHHVALSVVGSERLPMHTRATAAQRWASEHWLRVMTPATLNLTKRFV